MFSYQKQYRTLGHCLPGRLAIPLFGDRRRFGSEISEDDPDWQEWQSFYISFYQNTQKQGIGKVVNDAGYKILQRVSLDGRHVVELGPGILPHARFWTGTPVHYTAVDVKQEMLDRSMQVLGMKGIPATAYLSTSCELSIEDHQFDTVISFYSLEHLNPLNLYVEEINRVLRPGGILVGAIPAEGGLAWGLGRFLTSRRYIKRNSSINPDKIICWEHPNFAETILGELDRVFDPVLKEFWPLGLPVIDLNLVLKFIYRRSL